VGIDRSEPVTALPTDYAQGTTIPALEGTGGRASGEGLVTPEEGAAWLAQRRAASEAGRFFGAVTCFLVSGQKPP